MTRPIFGRPETGLDPQFLRNPLGCPTCGLDHSLPARLARPGDIVSDGLTDYLMLPNWPNTLPPGRFVVKEHGPVSEDERSGGIPVGWVSR